MSQAMSQAFDDLVEVLQKLGSNFGKGLSWTNDKIDKLKNVRRYLKSDYKVITIICACKYYYEMWYLENIHFTRV